MSPVLSTFSGASARAFGWGYNLNASAFELLETQTVGAGGAASITFSNIPGTYKHLQIRSVANCNRGGSTWPLDALLAQFNSDAGSNYVNHFVRGNGASASSGNDGISATRMFLGDAVVNTSFSSVIMGTSIVDILDYTSTSKNKTVRSLVGSDINGTWGSGTGVVGLFSASWMNSSTAVTSIKLLPGTNSFQQYSTFSLYGVK